MTISSTGKALGLAALVFVATATASLAATAFATTTVNVRTGPGPGYQAIDVLRPGERVDVDRCRGSWCYVIKRGPDGWVSANYLSRDRYYDEDYYDDYDDGFYLERPRKRFPVFPRSSICFGNPKASFCISD